jgi:hypothetical protein
MNNGRKNFRSPKQVSLKEASNDRQIKMDYHPGDRSHSFPFWDNAAKLPP